jgi:hypothetical protein
MQEVYINITMLKRSGSLPCARLDSSKLSELCAILRDIPGRPTYLLQ